MKTLIKKYKLFYRIAFICMLCTIIMECKPDNDSSPPKAEKENRVKCKVEEKDVLIDCQYKYILDGSTKDNIIKVPVYGGKEGEIGILELIKKLNIGNILPHFGYSYTAGGGKKKLLDILEFYKGNLLKDIDIYRPSVIGGEGRGWIIWYDYDAPGDEPGTVMIMAPMPSEKDKLDYDESLVDDDSVIRDIRAIYLDESPSKDGNNKVILVNFFFGERSQFYKEKENP